MLDSFAAGKLKDLHLLPIIAVQDLRYELSHAYTRQHWMGAVAMQVRPFESLLLGCAHAQGQQQAADTDNFNVACL
jgi:hypothetical protein